MIKQMQSWDRKFVRADIFCYRRGSDGGSGGIVGNMSVREFSSAVAADADVVVVVDVGIIVIVTGAAISGDSR